MVFMLSKIFLTSPLLYILHTKNYCKPVKLYCCAIEVQIILHQILLITIFCLLWIQLLFWYAVNNIFQPFFSHQVLGLSMAHLSWKMHSMAAHLWMWHWGKSNSCFQTVSGHRISILLRKTHNHTPFCSCGLPLSAALIEPLPSREAIDEYLSMYVNPTLLRGLTEVCKHKPHNPCVST